jgi:uncharacterized protein (DUF4415 family)
MKKTWPSFETNGLPDTVEGDAEMMRRWQTYDRDMKILIAAGGVHQDEDGWWVETATGALIGPDPEIERPMGDADVADFKPFDEVFPELAASIRRRRGAGKAQPKTIVTVRLDPDVVEAFKADGPGWQSRMNAALRQAKKLPDRAA